MKLDICLGRCTHMGIEGTEQINSLLAFGCERHNAVEAHKKQGLKNVSAPEFVEAVEVLAAGGGFGCFGFAVFSGRFAGAEKIH
jgi:hypothetical protein